MNDGLMNRMIQEGYSLVSIDLFSGPGGLCTGFKWAGVLPLIAVEWTDTTVETYSVSHNADVLHLSEYVNGDEVNEEYLNQFMQENPRSLVIHGDINLVTNHMICELLLHRYGIDSHNETVDIVSGGAPCESFSMAGTRTVGDERDDLFDNIVRISRAVRTKAILFENVKGMFSKADANGRRGAIFQHICDTFESPDSDPSYCLASRNPEEILMKACDYGVPQLRERLFLVSIRRDLYDDGVRYIYPTPTHGPNCAHPYVTANDAISDLPEVGMGEGADIMPYEPLVEFANENQQWFVEIVRGHHDEEGLHSHVPQHLIEAGLFADNLVGFHKGPGHVRRKQELLELIPEGSSMKATYASLERDGRLERYRHLFPNTIYGCRNRRLIRNEPSFTVTSHCLDEILHPVLNRAITPREAARLQSFPDWYQFAGPYVQFHGDKVQDKYEQIGDAIPPLLAHAMARQFVNCIPPHI